MTRDLAFVITRIIRLLIRIQKKKNFSNIPSMIIKKKDPFNV